MDRRLVQLIEKALVSREIGSLFVGQGRKMRQLFLAGNEVYLIEAGREVRFCPLPFLLDGSVVPPSELDIVLSRFGSTPQSLSGILSEDYKLSDRQVEQIRRHETVEEALMVLENGGDRFVFEPGTVPEEILLPEDNDLTPVPNSTFQKKLRTRLTESLEVSAVFPHSDEQIVLNGEGSAQHTQGNQWLFSRVADLVDGFRDLRRIEKDSLFPPHLTRKLLSAAAQRGWIRKKLFPEFADLQLDKLSETELAELVDRIEGSIPLAVDEVPLRKTLTEILERGGDRSQLLSHHLAIGDQLLGRKERQTALEAYRRAVEIAPRSPDACKRLAQVLEDCADEAISRGNADEARRFLEEALPLRTQDESIALRIVQSHGSDEGGAARAATRLAGMMHQDGQGERALRFLHSSLQCYPNSNVLRRTYINFLLDHGLSDHALRELDVLAQELLSRGHDEEARQIFEKIVRLDPDRVPKEQRAKLAKAKPVRPDPKMVKRRQRRHRRRRIAAAVILAFALVGSYQGFQWKRAGALEERASALLLEELPAAGTEEHRELQRRWQEILNDARTVENGFSIGLGALRLGDASDSWAKQLDELQQAAEGHLEQLLRQARLAEIQGSAEEALELYREIRRNATDAKWREVAREKLTGLESANSAANELRARGQSALDRGNRAEAFELWRELINLYPSAEASAGILLPVRIVTEPAGLEIWIDGTSRGTSPLDLELRPYQPLEIISRRGDERVAVLRLTDLRSQTIVVKAEVDESNAPRE